MCLIIKKLRKIILNFFKFSSSKTESLLAALFTRASATVLAFVVRFLFEEIVVPLVSEIILQYFLMNVGDESTSCVLNLPCKYDYTHHSEHTRSNILYNYMK